MAPMSDQVLEVFAAGDRRTAVALPFALDELIRDWEAVRRAMRGPVPEPFARDEWAYLMSSLGATELRAVFSSAFGQPAPNEPANALAVPRPSVAVWLPNNVSLLGPLVRSWSR